ncbi:hypothetical protein ColLi_10324 [Colletotrichum liriopes]|uniref:Uncharacterized protein n=1 Tax=Colletotrichum liriopes TaxID=708192 RepID=A0AA37GW39_9PEZI|nr:hypothetical protein ColLi_10324 [Colletotrichum liriopes]
MDARLAEQTNPASSSKRQAAETRHSHLHWVMLYTSQQCDESTLRTLTRPSRGISTLSPDEAASVPLDPDGNSTGTTRKTWEQRRAKTPTTIGRESSDGQDDDVEQAQHQERDVREDAHERNIRHIDTYDEDADYSRHV